MIEEIAQYLRLGEVVIFPTETVYALAASALNSQAIDKIYQIKQRSKKKYLPIMFAGFKHLLPFTNLSEFQEEIIKKFSPGPVTFIIKRKEDCSLKFNFPEKIAVRIPDCKIALKILKAFKRPIVATSLNLSNKNTSVIIDEYFRKKVKCIIQHNQSMSNKPSVIIDISDNVVKFIRSGDSKLKI